MRCQLKKCCFIFASAFLFFKAVFAFAEEPFCDVHFHLTNYVQKGITCEDFLKIAGDRVERVALFGIPLQQKHDFFVNPDKTPDYYLGTDASLYYYSFVDTIIAHSYLSLPVQDRERFDPMITGFNPTDMYATDHIKRVLKIYPDVFVGIGEFTIHKEFVSSKVTGHVASLHNKALSNIFSFAEECGLIVLIHCDISDLRGDENSHFQGLFSLFERHPDTTIIWAHTGLGRFVAPSKNHLAMLEKMLKKLKNVCLDISWDEVAKYITEDKDAVEKWADLISRYPDRFIFGTDSVAPKDQESYLKTYNDYKALWERLDEDTLRKVTRDNYIRVFDVAKKRVRMWEKENL